MFAFLISEDNPKYSKIPTICEENPDIYFCMNFPKQCSLSSSFYFLFSCLFVCLLWVFGVSFATTLVYDNECANPAL